MSAPRLRSCPRCDACYFNSERAASVSRTTRDNGPPIYVCNRCGQAETFNVVPFADWPLSIENLLAEEHVRIESHRNSTLESVSLGDLDYEEEGS